MLFLGVEPLEFTLVGAALLWFESEVLLDAFKRDLRLVIESLFGAWPT